MENLRSYKKQIKEIKALIDKLEMGDLKLSELSDLERLTREMHEKSIILKYKAYEEKSTSIHEDPVVTKSEIKEVVIEEASQEEPSIDFSLFASEEDSNETEEAMVDIIEEPQETVVEPEPIPEPEPEQQVEAKKGVVREEIETKKEEGTSFVDRFRKEDDSISSKFAGAKIDTLVGAFGLNQKLGFINMLFNGSSEKFGDAIKLLDSQENFEIASAKVNEIADENDWDPEEETVIEFMEILNRRYA